MPLIGFGVVWVGYSLAYYGVTQIRGGNWGLFDLVLPGKFNPAAPNDNPGSTTKPGAYGANGPPSTAPVNGTAGAQGAAAAVAAGNANGKPVN